MRAIDLEGERPREPQDYITAIRHRMTLRPTCCWCWRTRFDPLEIRCYNKTVSEKRQIVFTLRAVVSGVEVTPETIDLALFNRFNRQVEQFLAGSNHQVAPRDILVGIESGSYRLVASLAVPAAVVVESDLAHLERQDGLSEMDPRRTAIVKDWQEHARKTSGYGVEISSPASTFRPVVISHETDYHAEDADQWVAVEKYVLGRLVDLGGMTKANAHLVLEDTGETLIIESTPEFLRDQRQNYLYQVVQVRITAEQNIRSGKLRNERLVEIVGPRPSYNPSDLDAFVAAGTKAWADVPDAVAWVREQRGG